MTTTLRTRLVAPLVLILSACPAGDGKNALLRTITEAAGTHCAQGGVAVQAGLDKNGNGTLDDAEVDATQTSYVCNGATGANGTPGATGAPGAQGPAGAAGLDGARTLWSVTPLSAGAACPNGGTRIDTGLDTNGDGTLEATEVTATTNLCDTTGLSAVHFGDITVASAADLTQLDGVEVVVGNLSFTDVFGTSLDLPTLRAVSGTISFSSSSAPPKGGGVSGAPRLPPSLTGLASVSFAALEHAGWLTVQQQTDLTSFSAPKLRYAYSLTLSDDALLTQVDLSALVSSSHALSITNDPALTTLSLPALVGANMLDFSGNAALTSLGLPVLAATYGLTVSGSGLATLSLPRLADANALTLADNASLTTLELPVLAKSDGSLNILRNAALTTLSFPALAKVNQLTVGSHATLATLSAPAFTQVNGFYISNNPVLDTCAVERLVAGLAATPSIIIVGNDTTKTCTFADRCHRFSVVDAGFITCLDHLAWSDAQALCADAGADLAWFDSQAQFSGYRDAIDGGLAPRETWLGYTDVVTTGTWVPTHAGVTSTLDLSTTNQDFWNPGEGHDGPPDTCALMWPRWEWHTGVIDGACSSLMAPLCRVP
jgi:hypothetical protein